MGLALGQTIGNAGADFLKAREQKIGEEQTAAELQLRQQQFARQLAIQMKQLEIEKARAQWEQHRAATEEERLKSMGWTKTGQDYQNPDSTWTSLWYNPVTGEKREVRTGTPKAVAIQNIKGDQAQDLEAQRNRDKLEQIAASGRWHVRWAQIAAQGKLKKEDWNALRTDPGYIQAIGNMRAALQERNMILARMYSTTNPPSPEQLTQLNQQLQQVDAQLEQAAKSGEQVRNRIRFGVNQASGSIADLAKMVGSQIGPPRPQGVPDNYVYRANGTKGAGWYAPGTN